MDHGCDRLIFCVSGNHDGEGFSGVIGPCIFAAFETNFCAPAGSQVPLASQMAGVLICRTSEAIFGTMQALLPNIIGLYSNADENVGVITARYRWSRAKGLAGGAIDGDCRALIEDEPEGAGAGDASSAVCACLWGDRIRASGQLRRCARGH